METPIIAPGPEAGKGGPWKYFQPRILLPAALALVVVGLMAIHFIGLAFSGHKESPQDAAQRKAQQQYEQQTTPASPADVAGFASQTTKAATESATAKALSGLVAQGLGGQNAASANPLAVPGNPTNSDPAVYKAWADAEATARLSGYAPGSTQPGAPGTANASGSATASTVDEARQEAKKRAQQRLAASSIAIDFTRQASEEKKTPADPDTRIPVEQPETQQPAIASAAGTPPSSEKVEPIPVKLHTCIDLCEGDLLPGVLTNRIDGAQAGFADVMITEPVYSHTWDPQGRRLLIPIGSRVLGNVTAVNSAQAQRLFVAFHKVRRPDGSTFSLDNFTGLDMAGASGLRDLVNHHYFSIFGASLAIAAIGGVAQAGNSTSGFGYDPNVSIRNGISQQLAQQSMQVLDRFLSQPPTMTIREGKTLVRIYISQDLAVPEYGRKELYAQR